MNINYQYIIIGFVAFFVLFFVIVFPIIKRRAMKRHTDFFNKNKGKEELFRNELLNENFSFILPLVESKPIGMVECELKRTLGDKAKELAASTARSLVQRAAGGSSRDINKPVFFSYLLFDELNFYYLEFDDSFNFSKKMVFSLSKMKELKQEQKSKNSLNSFSFMALCCL